MYEPFFGLQKPPFNLTPDPAFLYLTPQYQEALAGLTYSIMARKGFVVLAGNAGTGKTTLLRLIMQRLSVHRVLSSVILNPTLSPAEFLEATMLDFGFTEIPGSKPQRIAALQSFLWRAQGEGKISALIIDEAHKLSPELFEEIRLLGNFESADEKLLQIALVGQSELDDLLNSDGLTAFRQRIALRLSLQPLSGQEIEHYIGYRWAKAGGSASPFTAEAVKKICEASQGIPRVINVICDNALMEAFGSESAAVEVRHVIDACQDLHLVKAAPQTAALPAEALAPIPAVDGFSMKTLERYALSDSKSSLLMRLRSKLGLVRRMEIA
jgi:general secretion pathway protein A